MVDLQMRGGQSEVSMDVEAGEKPDEIRPFVHVPADNVLIMPYGTAWAAGGTLRSIGVRFGENVRGQPLLEDFLTRVAVTLFAGIRDPLTGEVEVSSYTSVGMTAVEGLGALIVPLVIAALIVLNTMLGAVYERQREIGVYSAVGLAPMHIALLFVAEACVYAVVGVTLGYILGQGAAKLLLGLGLLHYLLHLLQKMLLLRHFHHYLLLRQLVYQVHLLLLSSIFLLLLLLQRLKHMNLLIRKQPLLVHFVHQSSKDQMHHHLYFLNGKN